MHSHVWPCVCEAGKANLKEGGEEECRCVEREGGQILRLSPAWMLDSFPVHLVAQLFLVLNVLKLPYVF